ncbi:MAG: methyltransferase domain-containing protein [Acidobacteriota bacterium]
MTKSKRELAYLYDLYIAPTWRDCYDRLFNEKLGLPTNGRILDVNCGTGGHAIEMAFALANKGSVIGVDTSLDMIELAHAKAIAAKVGNLNFYVGQAASLAFSDNSFDLVIGDATFSLLDDIKAQLAELVRVALPGARVVLNVTTRGSFDEFFSIFWEALYECQLAEELLSQLETLINARPKVSDVEAVLHEVGLAATQSFQHKECFSYDSAEQFFSAPLIEDYLLGDWLSILPPYALIPVRDALTRIIERERGNYSFDISAKVAMFAGEKRGKRAVRTNGK